MLLQSYICCQVRRLKKKIFFFKGRRRKTLHCKNGSVRDTMCIDSWMSICTDITTHLVGPFMWLVAKMCEKWKLSLSLFITDAVCCCFLPFFFLEVSPRQYKMTRGKIKASLFHSWVTITDGHVRSAKTNSSSDKHNRVERCGGRICQDPHSYIAGSGKRTVCRGRC